MFARGLKKAVNGININPTPENIIVIGGAGAGKSTVIKCLSQWCHRILASPGDDPNSPYVLKAATTGAAAGSSHEAPRPASAKMAFPGAASWHIVVAAHERGANPALQEAATVG